MKSLKLSLALIVTLGLGSVALADDAAATAAPCNSGCGSCGGCGHGLLSKLSLHRCNPCCDAPKPCPTPCDPCAGHKLIGMIHCIKLPSLHGCGSCGGCAPKCERPTCCKPACEPKPCAPKCCAPRPCAPKCCHEFHMPQICLPKIRIECCKPACEPKPCAPKCCKPACPKPCDPCGGHFASLTSLFHHNSCCEPKPACDPCANKCSLSSLFGKRCCPCDGAAAPAPAEAAPSSPTPAPKPMGAGTNSNGLLILTPAG